MELALSKLAISDRPDRRGKGETSPCSYTSTFSGIVLNEGVIGRDLYGGLLAILTGGKLYCALAITRNLPAPFCGVWIFPHMRHRTQNPVATALGPDRLLRNRGRSVSNTERKEA
jgi:hypothetical protein